MELGAGKAIVWPELNGLFCGHLGDNDDDRKAASRGTLSPTLWAPGQVK